MYQRQLWDTECLLGQKALESLEEVEEWHFHIYGPCGVFLIDMRGNRISSHGVQKEGPIMSLRQRAAIEQAFSTSNLSCMILASEIPFVGDSPEAIRERVKDTPFLVDHWPYQLNELTWLLDLCFGWKNAVSGREVIMLGGDIHVSVDSLISDQLTGQTIRHITTSPITNHVCEYYPDLTGMLNSRYSFTHTPMLKQRTFCTIDLTFNQGTAVANVVLCGVPAV